MILLYAIGIIVMSIFAIGAFVCNNEEKRFRNKQ